MNLNMNKLTKKFYNEQDNVWPEDSNWYKYTTKFISDFIYNEYIKITKTNSTPVILNAGSGGSTYNISNEMWHTDIIEGKINHFKKHIVCNVENMPFEDNFFDLCICVGSVINYCDAINVIKELLRCLKPSGKIILEFESSVTGELLFKKDFAKNIVLFNSIYLDGYHTQWLYNPKFIINIIKKFDVEIHEICKFHVLSSSLLAFFNEEKAYKFSKYDYIVRKIPILKNISSNVIITFSKRS